MGIESGLQRRIAVSISFGGTKIAVALVDRAARHILVQSERIEWRNLANNTQSICALVADTTKVLLRSLQMNVRDIGVVGIAWPGPGQYSVGEVQATFVPGFEVPKNVFALLDLAFKKELGSPLTPNEWRCYLDVAARARGELLIPEGAWASGDSKSGFLVNIATGVAGALVRNRELVTRLPDLGETYGQWGRFLVCNRTSGVWQWRPTADGSVPYVDRKTEARLTEICGGPALAHEFSSLYAEASGLFDPDLCQLSSDLRKAFARPVETELRLLRSITEHSRTGNEAAARFVQRAGISIGAAIRCLRLSLRLDVLDSCVVLTGGVGENFGRPSDGVPDPDLLLVAASSAFGDASTRWTRSRLGLSAELLGAVI
jgi:hypothetical protein